MAINYYAAGDQGLQLPALRGVLNAMQALCGCPTLLALCCCISNEFVQVGDGELETRNITPPPCSPAYVHAAARPALHARVAGCFGVLACGKFWRPGLGQPQVLVRKAALALPPFPAPVHVCLVCQRCWLASSHCPSSAGCVPERARPLNALRVSPPSPFCRGLKYKDSSITPYGTSKICMILLAMEMSKCEGWSGACLC